MINFFFGSYDFVGLDVVLVVDKYVMVKMFCVIGVLVDLLVYFLGVVLVYNFLGVMGFKFSIENIVKIFMF